MKILSWNVNGIRAAEKKGFSGWLSQVDAEMVCLQEVRALENQIPPAIMDAEGWHKHFFAAERKGYSGVGTLSRHAFSSVETTLGVDEYDVEGRIQIMKVGALTVVNGYFPNGNGKNRDNSRIPYKLAFFDRLMELLEPARAAGENILVLGDFNTAHQAVDLARPKQNVKTSGFRPEERLSLDKWLKVGWIDTFRHFNPDVEGAYTWWSNRAGARGRNVGWRIDYVWASEGAMRYVKDAFILKDVMGSDHCPLGVEVDHAVLGD